MNGIYTIRHILCLTEAVFITDDNISFIFFCCVKAAERFEIDFKGCTVFRCLNLCFSVIGMLDDGDITFHNLLCNIICCLIVFNRIKLRFSTDLMDCGIKQIALGRSDFTDCPVVITDIFLCGKLTVLIRYILVHKGFAFIDTVNCSGKGSVALRRSFLTVALCYSYAELFENVREIAGCNIFPVNRCGLICRHNITDSRIYFFNSVRGSTADKHIIERSNTVLICYGIFIYGNTRKRSAVKVEGNALYKIILRRFDNLKITSLENIIEVDLCHLTGNDSYSVNLLRHILVNRLLCDRVNTGHKVIKLELTAVCGCDCLIYTVTADSKLNAVNLSVLTCLYNLTRAVADLHFDKAADRVADLLSVSDHILNAVSVLMDTVRPYDNTSADTVLFCGCDGKFLARSFLHRNSQFVSADRERNAVNICREIVIAKHTVCIGESCNILASVPFKLVHLGRTA